MKINDKAKGSAIVLACAMLAACGGGGGGTGGAAGPGSGSTPTTPVVPVVPVVPATPVVAAIPSGEFGVMAGALAPLTCQASGGTGPYSFAWKVVDNKGLNIALSTYSAAQSTFMAPQVAAATQVELACDATDSKGVVGKVQFKVTLAPGVEPSPLTAQAGPGFLAAGGSSAKLHCQAEGGVAPYSYRWKILDNKGHPISLSSYGGADVSFVAPAVPAKTALDFECSALDSAGLSAKGAVSVEVDAPAAMALVAAASPGRVVAPGQVVTVDSAGSGWFGVDGKPAAGPALSYGWGVAPGAPGVLFANPKAGTTTFVVPIDPGYPKNFTVELAVQSGAGAGQVSKASSTFTIDPYSTLSVSVTPPAQALVPGAGGKYPAASLSASGTASSSAPTIYYLWTQVSGPAVAIGGATTANMGFVPSDAGQYVFRVAVGYQPIRAGVYDGVYFAEGVVVAQ